jgi:hypothetical protein
MAVQKVLCKSHFRPSIGTMIDLLEFILKDWSAIAAIVGAVCVGVRRAWRAWKRPRNPAPARYQPFRRRVAFVADWNKW